MKNKIVTIGTLCLVLVLGLVFVGCDDFQKVEFGSVGKVKDITVNRVGSTTTYIVSFTGVGENIGYSLLFQPDGAKAYNSLTGTPSNTSVISVNDAGTGVVTSTNANPDKYYATVTLTITGQNGATKGKVVVRSNPTNNRNDKNPAFAKSGDVTLF